MNRAAVFELISWIFEIHTSDVRYSSVCNSDVIVSGFCIHITVLHWEPPGLAWRLTRWPVLCRVSERASPESVCLPPHSCSKRLRKRWLHRTYRKKLMELFICSMTWEISLKIIMPGSVDSQIFCFRINPTKWDTAFGMTKTTNTRAAPINMWVVLFCNSWQLADVKLCIFSVGSCRLYAILVGCTRSKEFLRRWNSL